MIPHLPPLLHILVIGFVQEIFNLLRAFAEWLFDPKQTTGEFLLKISIPLLIIGGRFLIIRMNERREEKETKKTVQKNWEWKQKEKEVEAPSASSYRVLVIIAVVLGIVMLCVLFDRFQ
jgi:hypothetical protein